MGIDPDGRPSISGARAALKKAAPGDQFLGKPATRACPMGGIRTIRGKCSVQARKSKLYAIVKNHRYRTYCKTPEYALKLVLVAGVCLKISTWWAGTAV
jgi:hypothetical protein